MSVSVVSRSLERLLRRRIHLCFRKKDLRKKKVAKIRYDIYSPCKYSFTIDRQFVYSEIRGNEGFAADLESRATTSSNVSEKRHEHMRVGGKK